MYRAAVVYGPAACGLVVLLCVCGAALSGGPDDNSYFAARREKVMQKIGGCIAVLPGAIETRAYEPFRQDNNFYYLTGVETPGAYLLLDAARQRSVLFLPARNVNREQWEGPRLFPGDEAKAATGMDDVLDISRLEAELQKCKPGLKHIYVPLAPEEVAATSRDRAAEYDSARERNVWDGVRSRPKALAQALRQKLGASAAIADLTPILDSMRCIKDEQEIGRMREAARIGALGMKEAIRDAGPGRFEYQVAAAATFVFRWNGAAGPAYFPIVGSGPNSCFLHYSADTRRMESGDIVVMDYGAEYRYYDSDITRSFPVSGRFSEEQSRLYEVVMEAERAAIGKVKPGASFADLNAAAHAVAERHGYGRYWQHGVSHFVGMSVHDVGAATRFEPGMVITVEPGLYLSEKNLGIRIEDTVLITRDGCEVLTLDVPKERAEIEKLMAEKGLVPAR
jgi:Xaa-Pro aminopeptidase